MFLATGEQKYHRELLEHFNPAVVKLKEIIDAFFELIFFGVLERYPKLKFVSVENEIGWMPFMLQQWDYYYNRFKGVNPPPISKDPSEYFATQIYGTFFRDTVAGHNFEWWGQDNCMWSNDYPHAASPWPPCSSSLRSRFTLPSVRSSRGQAGGLR